MEKNDTLLRKVIIDYVNLIRSEMNLFCRTRDLLKSDNYFFIEYFENHCKAFIVKFLYTKK